MPTRSKTVRRFIAPLLALFLIALGYSAACAYTYTPPTSPGGPPGGSAIDQSMKQWRQDREREEMVEENAKKIQEQREAHSADAPPPESPAIVTVLPDAPPAAGSPVYQFDIVYFMRYPGTASWPAFILALLIAPVGVAISGQLTNLIGALAMLYTVYRISIALYRKGVGIILYVAASYAYATYFCILGAIMDGRVMTAPRYFLTLQKDLVPAGEPASAVGVALGFVFATLCALGVKYAIARWRCEDDENAAKTCALSTIAVFAIPTFVRAFVKADAGGFWALILRGFTGSFLLLAVFGLLFDAILLQRALGHDKAESASIALWTNAAAATVTVAIAALFKAFFV